MKSRTARWSTRATPYLEPAQLPHGFAPMCDQVCQLPHGACLVLLQGPHLPLQFPAAHTIGPYA
jgi:hypothetical protein